MPTWLALTLLGLVMAALLSGYYTMTLKYGPKWAAKKKDN
jgi:hypothetical protein